MLANDTIVTVFMMLAKSNMGESLGIANGFDEQLRHRGQQVHVLRWTIPTREIVGGNGFFQPAEVLVPSY